MAGSKEKELSLDEKSTLMRWATYASVTTAALIITGKVAAWFATGSISLLSTLIDSILDITASLINLMAVRYALQPPDDDHRFGHGKAEDIAAFAQSAFIMGSALFVFTEALSRLVKPQALEVVDVGIIVMVFSIIMTALLITFQRYVIRRTQSSAISADYLHYTMDVIVNIMVILTLAASAYWNTRYLDPVVAIGIAAYIARGAWKVGRGAFNKLMDREFDEIDRDKIKSIILSHHNIKDIKGFHDLRTRYSGIHAFIQFHLEFDGTITLDQSHMIAESIEADILKAFPNAEVTIHQDPADVEELSLVKEQVKTI